VATGVVLQGYTLRADDIFALTDSASVAIARDFRIDPPSDAIATVRTKSAVAYALYENGLSALSHSDVSSSYELLCAALERDSTFAMAAAHAWSVALVLEKRDDAARLLPIVKRLAAGTSERERLWIESLVAFYTGQPLAEQLVLIERLTRRYPGDAEGLLLNGRIQFAAGDFAAAVSAFDRAVFIDSATGPIGSYCRVCGAIFMMTDSYMWWDSLAAAERSARRLASLRYVGRPETGGLVEVLLRQGRRREAEEFAASLRAARPGEVMDFSGPLNRDLIRSGRLAELEASLLASLKTAVPGAYGEMPWLLLFTLRNQGRLNEAYLLASEGVVPTISVRLPAYHDPLSTAVVALERGDSKEAARRFMEMVAAMRAPGYDPGPPWARHMVFRMTLTGMALAAVGDTSTVRALADSIRVIGPGSNWARDIRLQHFLEGLLYQRQNRHAEAVDAFHKAVFSNSDGFTRINLEMARSLLVLGRNAEAVAVLRPSVTGGVDGGNTYVTHTELHELLGHAFFAAGQRDSAAVHYRAVEEAWRGADPSFAARYALAKTRAGL
jgi:tetratricopeptide (TPR) repeat protein